MVKRKINKNDLSNKRRRVYRKRLLFFVCFTFLMIAGVVAIFRVSIFRLHDVKVFGAKNISAEKVKQIVIENITGNYFFIIPKNNTFFYPRNKIVSDILGEFSQIASVGLNAGFSGVISVVVKEKIQYAFWCSKDKICYSMDSNGFIFEEATNLDKEKFIFRGLISGNPVGQNFSDQNTINNFVLFSKKLSNRGLTVSSITVFDDDSAEAYIDNGMTIKFIPKEVTNKDLIKNLEIFLNNFDKSALSQFDYIDIRYGNKIFYKIK